MYCERCGKLLDEALNFCNSCGAKLKKSGDAADRSVLNNLITALIVVATGGIGVLAGLLAILLDKVSDLDTVLKFVVIYLVALVGICFMIMRQVSKLIDAKLTRRDLFETVSPPATQPAVQLPPRTTAQLEEARQPASVVDATTRTLDEVPIHRRS